MKESVAKKYYYTSTTGSSESITYNKDVVKKFAVTVSEIEGYDVTIATTPETSNITSITDPQTKTYTFTLDGASTNYVIKVIDSVGNEKTIKTFIMTGNNLTGSVTYDKNNTTNGDKTLFDENTEPKTIYFNHTEVTALKLSASTLPEGTTLKYRFRNGDEDVTNPIDSEEMTIPCPETTSYEVTYKIIAIDNTNAETLLDTYILKGASPTGSSDIAENGVGKQTDNEDPSSFTSTVAATSTDVGTYILTNNTATTTIKYNPKSVNKAKITISEVSDITGSCTNLKIVVMNGSTEICKKDYVDGLIIPVTLDPSWTSDYTTYDVYVVDIVGNKTKIKSYEFKAYTIAPTSYVYKNGTSYDINYGDVDNNNGNIIWNEQEVRGLSSHAVKSENTFDKISVPGGTAYNIKDDVKFTVKISNKDNLVSNRLSYKLTYTYNTDSNPTNWNNNIATDWQDLQEIDDNDNITITVRPEDIQFAKTYLFVWLRDAIGNENVYNLTGESGQKSNWWYSDVTGPTVDFTFIIKKNGWEETTYGTDFNYSINESNKTITLNILKTLCSKTNNGNAFYIKPSVTDDLSELKSLLYDSSSMTNEAENWCSNNLPKNQATHTFTAEDNAGNKTVWTIKLNPVNSLPNISSNIIGGLPSGITTISSERNTSDSIAETSVSQSITAPAYTTSFASPVTDLTPVTNTSTLRRSRKSSKKTAKTVTALAENTSSVVRKTPSAPTLPEVAEVAVVAEEEITQIAQSVETAIESAALPQNSEASIEPVESVVQVVEELMDSVSAVDNIEKIAAEETTALSYANAQVSEAAVQSDPAEIKLFDIRSLYAAIAVFVAALSALIGIFITRSKKMKK